MRGCGSIAQACCATSCRTGNTLAFTSIAWSGSSWISQHVARRQRSPCTHASPGVADSTSIHSATTRPERLRATFVRRGSEAMNAVLDSPLTILRGSVLWFRADPFLAGVEAARVYEQDGAVAMRDGVIVACGPAAAVLQQFPPDTPVQRYDNALISAGFIDC